MSEPTDIAASQFRLLVQEVDEYAIFLLDPQGHVVSWNEGAKKIKGYSTAEILGQHFSTFYPAEATEAGTPERALRSARQEGKWIDEGWRVRQDGSRFWARVTITAVREEGRLQGFAKITHDLSDRRRREQELERKTQQRNKENALLRLTQKVTETANRADSLEGALEEAIPIICTHIGWPVGHVYWLREAGDHPLAPTGIWHLDKPDRFRQFRAVTEAVDFAMGESLPGRVAETKAPHWIRDVTSDESFVRSKRARNLGVKGAFGVPVKREDDIVAVLEFFSGQAEEQDDQLKEAIESVGLQLSRVAEREAARQSLRESEEKFCAVAEQTIVGIGFIQDGVYKYVNPALAQYVGYEQTDLIGCSPNGLSTQTTGRASRRPSGVGHPVSRTKCSTRPELKRATATPYIWKSTAGASSTKADPPSLGPSSTSPSDASSKKSCCRSKMQNGNGWGRSFTMGWARCSPLRESRSAG